LRRLARTGTSHKRNHMMRRTNGAATRDAIRRAAMVVFRTDGYLGAALDDIALSLGITRSAILYHFGSKSNLLRAVVDPYLDALDVALDRHQRTERPTHKQRRLLLTDVTDVVLAHRQAAGIVDRDITSLADDQIERRVTAIEDRFIRLLSGPDPTAADRIVATATLGAVLRPLTDPDIDPADPNTRTIVLDAAVAISRQIDRGSPRKPDSGPPG
jgi:AcrR family transcriptional regulator